MNKLKLIPILLLSLVPIYSIAKSDNGQSQQNTSNVPSQQQGQGDPSTVTNSGPGSSYQNQVQTQNKGEDQQIQVSTQQQSESGAINGSGKSVNDHASDVAKYVQELLNSNTLSGGIGDQVKEIAKLQNQSQEKIKAQINSVENKNKLMKLLLGTNYDAVKTMQMEMEQNRERVRNLLQLKEQVTDLADQQDIQALADSLDVQNLAIQDKISNELGQFSLFGWLVKILSK